MEPPGQRTTAQQRLVTAAKLAFDDWNFPLATTLVRQAWALGAAHLPAADLSPQARSATSNGHPNLRQVEPRHPDLKLQ